MPLCVYTGLRPSPCGGRISEGNLPTCPKCLYNSIRALVSERVRRALGDDRRRRCRLERGETLWLRLLLGRLLLGDHGADRLLEHGRARLDTAALDKARGDGDILRAAGTALVNFAVLIGERRETDSRETHRPIEHDLVPDRVVFRQLAGQQHDVDPVRAGRETSGELARRESVVQVGEFREFGLVQRTEALDLGEDFLAGLGGGRREDRLAGAGGGLDSGEQGTGGCGELLSHFRLRAAI